MNEREKPYTLEEVRRILVDWVVSNENSANELLNTHSGTPSTEDERQKLTVLITKRNSFQSVVRLIDFKRLVI